MTSPGTALIRPSCRKDFEIAIICALSLEYNAVYLIFDEFWDESGDEYGRAVGDVNNYTTGRIGKFNVVLALLSSMGKANAAQAASHMHSSYSGLQLVLLVGVCGGVPQASGDDEILLGDVVISKTLVQHDLGSQYPDKFIRKDTIQDNLGKPNKDVRNLLVVFETEPGLCRLQQKTAFFLTELQGKATQTKNRTKYRYPGTAEDKLYRPSYRHKHQSMPACICRNCHAKSDPVCDEALKATCDNLGCDQQQLVLRDRLLEKKGLELNGGQEAQEPAIHVGSTGSGDAVMKSGDMRDGIAEKEEVIAFEMEGAGIWDETPCIIVKGVCDYADSHKSKKWQNFAAATAASASKAILERYIKSDKPTGVIRGHADDTTGSFNTIMGDNLGGNIAAGPIGGDMNAECVIESGMDMRRSPRRDVAATRPDLIRGMDARPGVSGITIGGSNIGGNVASGAVQGNMNAGYRVGGSPAADSKPSKRWLMGFKRR